jgi:hypothetical protein
MNMRLKAGGRPPLEPGARLLKGQLALPKANYGSEAPR